MKFPENGRKPGSVRSADHWGTVTNYSNPDDITRQVSLTCWRCQERPALVQRSYPLNPICAACAETAAVEARGAARRRRVCAIWFNVISCLVVAVCVFLAYSLGRADGARWVLIAIRRGEVRP